MFVNDPREFDFLEIGLASPDRIRYWSYGEVEKPETINYRTFKPERKGLFCEKIFGPVKDWECSCGKYRRIRYRGIVCERCGVEVTHSKVRRERMAHIELAAPVTHIWFLKGIPSYIGVILEMSSRQLEEVIYFDSYIVTEADEDLSGTINKYDLISTLEYPEMKEKFKNKFKADIGARAIQTLLEDLNVDDIINKLREDLPEVKGQKKTKLIKRLRVLEALQKSGNQPEWLVLDVIPIMPPELRPMVQLEGGRFATSDLNDLYRRVVNRNNRLKRLMDIGAPEMIIRNEKRMLQEAVDVLIANGKRGRAVTGLNDRPLKSLGNIIEGKQGRFRQNLLGKRVDYSARSVIVVGPQLNFNQCGIPKEMALELFKPFIIRKLVEDGAASNVKSAKKKIESKDVVIWSVLEKVIKGKLVLLNRAPTLHRLGIQAFQPILVEGSAIQVHPLVCTAFNADFDGDQMAVHLPLSVEAQTECRLLIESTNNILSPSSGRAIVTPSQDMVLGIYYLTVDNEELNKKTYFYQDRNEAYRAYEMGYIKLQNKIKIKDSTGYLVTTMGRIIFNGTINEILRESNVKPETFINEVVGKKKLGDIVYNFYVKHGNEITSKVVNALKNIGFKYSTLSGISIAIDDLKIPSKKANIIESARKEIVKLSDLQENGVITDTEKLTRSNDIWRSTTYKVAEQLNSEMGSLNNVFMMANSGARGNMDQVRQLSGMRGLMSDSQGRIIEIPIRSNFKEGLTLTEYFISAYGARKGLVDTALRTADSGYLTRRLVDVAQDIMVTIEDCNVNEGLYYSSVKSENEIMIPISDVIEGRYSLETVIHPITKERLVKKNELISREAAKKIEEAGIESVKCRSVYKCKAERGICQKCYGIDLATTKPINVGEAVGIIAAQSIGEPGTQLTMRTFHTGGVDLRKASIIEVTSNVSGKVQFPKDLLISPVKEDGNISWVLRNDSEIFVIGKDSESSFNLMAGTRLSVKDKENVKIGDILGVYDPNDKFVFSADDGTVIYDESIITEIKGANKTSTFLSTRNGEMLVYNDSQISSIFVSKIIADKFQKDILIKPDDLPSGKLKKSGKIYDIKLNSDSRKKTDEYEIQIIFGNTYHFEKDAVIYQRSGAKVSAGESLLKQRLTSDASKTQDIVQGLPKVEELFEARKPKEIAILSEYNGVVDIIDNDIYWSVNIRTDEGTSKEYKLSKPCILNVHGGQIIKKGDRLNEGQLNPHDIAKTKGIDETRLYLSDEIQKVYASQGVSINKKHIETIVRQMTMKVTITEMGDSTLLLNEMIDVRTLNKINEELISLKKNPALGEPVLLGITRASLNTESFISASSFQQTAGVLTKAAVEGQIDKMQGLKENVIIGKLIPAGTGINTYKNVSLVMPEEEIIEEDMVVTTNDNN